MASDAGTMPRSRERRSRELPTPQSLRRVAVQAAKAAGRVTLESFGGRLKFEIKPDGSPVTVTDRESEAELRRIIRRSFPDHTIIGEETGETSGDSRVRWFLDPIDGTKSFIHGVPLYCVLVAVEVDGIPTVGVIHMPALNETVDAATGSGCTWNGRVAHVSRTARLGEATVLTTSVRALENEGVPFRRLASATKTQRSWGDGYGFALVATGRADAMIDSGLHPWDIAPMIPILEESGGRVTDWAGTRTISSTRYIASNGKLHESIRGLLRAKS